MSAKQKLRQANLTKWTAIFREQAESGLTVKQFCSDHDISVHAYNYWKHVAKEAYVESILPEIVPVNPPTPDQVPVNQLDSDYHFHPSSISRESRDFIKAEPVHDTDPISILISDIKIEIGSSASDELITRIIKAVRHA